MNLRLFTPCPRAVFVSAAIACGLAFTALAQPLPPPVAPAPGGAKPPGPAPAATTQPRPGPRVPTNEERDGSKPFDVATLNKFVKENVARMTSSDDFEAAVTEAMTARQDLVAASASPNPTIKQFASPVYLGAYLNALSRSLATLAADPKLTLRARINIGVATARVAENCKIAGLPASELQPVILALLKDKNDAVALWGMKAAASVCTAGKPPVTNPALVAQIVKTVTAHNLNGPITEEAYNALDGNPSPAVLNALMMIYKARIAAYANGQTPPDPVVDRRPSAILTVQRGAWAQLNATEQARVMNLIADLLAAASNSMTQPAAGASQETTDQLKTLITKTCEAVVVVAGDSPQLVELKNSAQGPATRTVTATAVADVVDKIRKAFPMLQTAKP